MGTTVIQAMLSLYPIFSATLPLRHLVAMLEAVCLSGQAFWTRIYKLLRSPGIGSMVSIPPAYEAWRAGTATLILLGFWPR
jgi:hypothetical protein